MDTTHGRPAGRLAGKVALVTGGAAGIGRAISRRFAREGAEVVVADIDAAGASRTAAETRGSTHEAHPVELDVSDEAAWRAVIGAVGAVHGRLDVLINNAGLPFRRPLADSTLVDWQQLMKVNAGGTFLGMKHATAAMTATGGGAIVNVCSAAALMGLAGLTTYAAGKGAVRAMTRVAAAEFASAGIRVNAVYPTSVRTAMAASDARAAGIPVEEFLSGAAALSLLGRVAEPEDVAASVLFLASDESAFITGAELVVDGGATAGFG